MRAPTGQRWRVLRAAVFAAVTGWPAAMGHSIGGGHPPDLAVLFIAALVIGGAISGLAVRRRTGPEIFGAVTVSQILFHLLFEVTSHTGELPVTGRMMAFHLAAAGASAWEMTAAESTLFRLFGETAPDPPPDHHPTGDRRAPCLDNGDRTIPDSERRCARPSVAFPAGDRPDWLTQVSLQTPDHQAHTSQAAPHDCAALLDPGITRRGLEWAFPVGVPTRQSAMGFPTGRPEAAPPSGQ